MTALARVILALVYVIVAWLTFSEHKRGRK